MSPYYPFLLHFKTKVSELLEIRSFMSNIFFEKLPKISKKFPEILTTFLKSKETIVFVSKLVRNCYIDEKLAKLSHITPKSGQFFLKPLIFQNFRRLRRRNLVIYVPKETKIF